MENDNLKIFILDDGDVLDIPPEGQHPDMVRLRRLHNTYTHDKHYIPYTVRQARLFKAISSFEYLNLPKMKSLGVRVVKCGSDRVNEHLGNSLLPESINRLSQKVSIIRAPSFVHYKDVNVVFGESGVCISKDGFVDPISTAITCRETLSQEAGRRIERGLVTLDRFGADNISHFLFDCLGREKAFRLYEEPDNSAVLMLPASISSYQQMCVEPIANKSYFVYGEVVHFRNLYVSCDITTEFDEGYSHPANFGNKDIIRKLTDDFRVEVKSKGYRKIYLSRRDSPRRLLENELDLEHYLESIGFECIAMSELKPRMQLQVMSQADIVIGQHGAAMTNIVACSAGTKVIELFNFDHGTDAYEVVSRSLNLDYFVYGMNGGSKSQNSIIDIAGFSMFMDKIFDGDTF